MDHTEQIEEMSKKLDELIDYFADEFTEITYAALIGILYIKANELIERSKDKK